MPNTAYVRAAIPRQAREELTSARLSEVVIAAWRRRVGTRLQPARQLAPAPLAVGAAVTLAGSEPATVLLSVPKQLAAVAAGTALDLRQDEIAPGDIDDILGEIITAIGEGLRAHVPEVTSVSAPLVVHGQPLEASVPSARLLCEATLQGIAGQVRVYVWSATNLQPALAH